MRESDLDAVGVGRLHGLDDGEVAVHRTSSGGVVLVPRAFKRLSQEARETVEEVQALAAEIGRLQVELDEAVRHARESGASWDLVGWSVGTSGSAARQRWIADQ